MRVNLAHINIQGVDVAVFDAKPNIDSDSYRQELLTSLTSRARLAGLRVEKSALAYVHLGQLMFYGTPDLVQYLQNSGMPGINRWLET